MVRQFRGGNRQRNNARGENNRPRRGGIYKPKGFQRGGGRFGKRTGDNYTKKGGHFRRFKDNKNQAEGTINQEDKLDTQLDNYWTKNGRPNKIDRNSALDKQLDNYWKNKPSTAEQRDNANGGDASLKTTAKQVGASTTTAPIQTKSTTTQASKAQNVTNNIEL